VIVTQIVGGIFLPKSEAFRNVPWTAAMLGTYGLSFYLMTVMIHRGTPLSMLLPFMAAVVPLALIGVGVWVYGEPASWSKLGVLTLACCLIGYAGTLK
jgi:multidrug transporter EmrE-like cation transporter